MTELRGAELIEKLAKNVRKRRMAIGNQIGGLL